jgi:hypothetical protein
LDPRKIEDYIASDDELKQRVGYFARALAQTGYRVNS